MSKADMDFLRLATWDTIEHTNVLADFLTEGDGEWEHGKWLQYHGWRRESVFIGTGYQQKRRHSIINVSGYTSDRNYRHLLEYDGYYATRVDLQITVAKPDKIALPDIYNQMKSEGHKTSLISSELNDTVYVGARTSDVFTRLYEKPLEKMYLRLEFEFKGKVARAIWRALQGKSTVDEIFQHYLEKSKLPPYVKVHYFEAQDGATAFATRQEIAKTDKQKLDWLQSIDASVRQALYNHNIGNEVQALVMSWANEASNVDRINEMN